MRWARVLTTALAVLAPAVALGDEAGAPADPADGGSILDGAAPVVAGDAAAATPTLTAPPADGEALAHPAEVASYTLKATLDPRAHTVHGEGTIRWRNASREPVHELWLHLYLNAFKNERSVFLREPVGQFRGGGLPSDWGYIDVKKLALGGADLWPGAELRRPGDDDETDARVPLPKEIAAGEQVTLDVVFDAKLPTVIERTGYDGSFHMVAQWFPKVARLEDDGRWAHFPFHHLAEFYADYGAYDVTIDVPQGFVVGATGSTVEARDEGGRHVERRVQADVHDFAFTAWDRFEKREEKIDGVAVTLLSPPGYRVVGERELDTLRFALPHFRERYGAYPYPVLTVVHPPSTAPEAGGMEYPTLITTGGPWFGPPGVLVTEEVTIHEFGHQYFYGLFASDEVTWPFLDEGMNSFAEQEGLGAWRGGGSGADLFGLRVANASFQAVISQRAAVDEPVAQPAFAFATGSDYGRLVYGRTASVFETVRRVWGDDATWRALGDYARRFRFRHPTPDDLLACYEREVGPEARAALRSALFERGWADYEVVAVSSHVRHAAAGVFGDGPDKKTVGVDTGRTGEHEGWALVVRRGTLVLPVEVELVAEDGTRTRATWDGHGDTARLPWKGSAPLAFAVVDPDHKVLLDQTFSNNFAAAPSAPRPSTRRSGERLLYWGEVLTSLIGP